ncbi:methyltransferase type 11 [Actinoplanes sp. SE50]|uniref:class I SAM-dependent methyltransferase n=1 Tax=unclassified Actinoplanes TaxID=2626549 RepID=UPI00023ECAB2|nr:MULTISPECIES: class I SAM-dependent methyltransferase [unclassified Actinoplanes]AEV82622.1 Ubiquinone/menaquinone biosynthesis methyltransferase ubiE [Actinoplanes sp. SE50/110]ATO81018.1 methyltransferase type 11 [Actinoplanes sp. SE50]SLL98425.1 methyltransferase type 11 [Actinoplanes sp. SE50/110]
MGEFHDPRLVEVYDAECPWGWDDDFFMAVLAERSAHRVADLGCGTGRLAIAMAAAGHEVIAIDPAPAALAAARRKPGGTRVRWLQGSAERLAPRSLDAAFMTGHVAQSFVDDEEWDTVLRGLRRALVPEGRLVFDSRDPDDRPWQQWNPQDSWRTVVLDDGRVVEAWSEAEQVGLNTVRVTGRYRFADGGELANSATLRFRTEPELRDSLREAGFRVERIYGGWGREPVGLSGDGEFIVIAVATPRLMS